MDKSEKIKLLKNQYQFTHETAAAYVESDGHCVYCNKDLLATLSDYFCADIDHLLPKKKYPEIESHPDNKVLSCKACNQIKGAMDIECLEWSPLEAITIHKECLIQKIKDKLEQRRKVHEITYVGVKNIIAI